MIFLLMLLIFWQGIRGNETGLIIDAYLSATPSELAKFVGGLLAVVLLAFAICLLPLVRGRPPLLAVKVMVLIFAQLLVACICFVGFGLLPVGTLGLLAAWLKFFVVIIGVSVVGGVLGSFAIGAWIVVYMHQGLTSWAMMGQAIEEGKGFLRIRLDAAGALTVHPISPRSWSPTSRSAPSRWSPPAVAPPRFRSPPARSPCRGSSRNRSRSSRPESELERLPEVGHVGLLVATQLYARRAGTATGTNPQVAHRREPSAGCPRRRAGWSR